MVRRGVGGFGETIVAESTASGHAALAVVRLSGEKAFAIAEGVAGTLPPPRVLRLRSLKGAGGRPIDHAMIVAMPGPRSYTGEDIVEFHTHGSPLVVQALLGRCRELGARHAEPGEFTERAFIGGRMDLLQVEAVADLIAAESEADREFALLQSTGEFSSLVRDVTMRVEKVVADWRAAIDFSDYLDDEEITTDHYLELEAIEKLLRGWRNEADGRARGGRSVVLCGPPNAGKSTLLNAWMDDERALVDAEPGTTRDPIEVSVNVGHHRFSLWDTAGLRVASDHLEERGVALAKRRIVEADFALWLSPTDAMRWPDESFDRAVLRFGGKHGGVVLTKTDLVTSSELAELEQEVRRRGWGYLGAVSAPSSKGLSTLRDQVYRTLDPTVVGAGRIAYRRRHLEAIDEALSALDRLHGAAEAPLDVKTSELERVIHALGRLLGRDVEGALLDRIFDEFCIGK